MWLHAPTERVDCGFIPQTKHYMSTVRSLEAVDELFYNTPVNFGSVNAGTKTPMVTANFQFNSGVTLPKIYQSVQGDYTGEFRTNTVSCTTPAGGPGSAGTTGATCSFTFGATYLSTTPGLRSGAVGYTDSNNDTLVVRASAIDVAASLALYPGTQISLTGQSFIETPHEDLLD